MVIGLEASFPGEDQPHEGDRQGDQQPAELIPIGLHLVEHQAGVRVPLFEQGIDQWHPGVVDCDRPI